MALYTETLKDWLNNGFTLPAIFSSIPQLTSSMTFAQLFESYFGEWEIGFETEEMFEMKLNLKANIVIPLYVKKIEMINEQLDNIFKNETIRRTYLNNTNVSTLTDDVGNSAESVETKIPDATLNAITTVQFRLNSIYENLLDEFKSLFMGLC